MGVTNSRVLQRRATGACPAVAPPIVHQVLASPGHPLAASEREAFEPRFGHDFSNVRIHTDERAAESADAVRARAYTVGRDVVFGAGEYEPGASGGRQLLTHELTHVVQQSTGGSLAGAPLRIGDAQSQAEHEAERIAAGSGGERPPQVRVAPATLHREPTYPDTSCDSVRANITAAWPTARRWVQNARTRLVNATAESSALQRHFRINPSEPAHAPELAIVRQVFDTMQTLLDGDLDQRCKPANADSQCQLEDGRTYAAYVQAGRSLDGITHCLASADAGFLSRENLIETLVHEVSHLADPNSTDHAYLHETTTYAAMTRQQAVRNADSYSEFARDMFTGGSQSTILLGLTPGVLLSSGDPHFAITANFDFRTHSGIEVFDLIGGYHLFLGLDPSPEPDESVVSRAGFAVDFGFLTRSPQSHLFADVRLGAFLSVDPSGEPKAQVGPSVDTLVGWADSGFRAGINVRQLYDVLEGNHAWIIGGEFSLLP